MALLWELLGIRNIWLEICSGCSVGIALRLTVHWIHYTPLSCEHYTLTVTNICWILCCRVGIFCCFCGGFGFVSFFVCVFRGFYFLCVCVCVYVDILFIYYYYLFIFFFFTIIIHLALTTDKSLHFFSVFFKNIFLHCTQNVLMNIALFFYSPCLSLW